MGIGRIFSFANVGVKGSNATILSERRLEVHAPVRNGLATSERRS
jgi:hypothetical protein